LVGLVADWTVLLVFVVDKVTGTAYDLVCGDCEGSFKVKDTVCDDTDSVKEFVSIFHYGTVYLDSRAD
jgi:hypothetical protein